MGRNITNKWSNTISVDWRWKQSKDKRFTVDWFGAYDVNLNEYIFTCTCKGLCTRCKYVKKEVSCLPFCSCACIASQENIVGQFIYTYTEAYLEPSQTSMIQLFCKNSKQLQTANYLFKKAPSQIFGWVQNTSPIWMYLVIFRSVSSACIHVSILCVIVCQKIV